VLIIKELNCILVIKDGSGLIEGDPMFFEIGGGLAGIPLKPNHAYIVLLDFRPSMANSTDLKEP
jgi:hypothetical protein